MWHQTCFVRHALPACSYCQFADLAHFCKMMEGWRERKRERERERTVEREKKAERKAQNKGKIESQRALWINEVEERYIDEKYKLSFICPSSFSSVLLIFVSLPPFYSSFSRFLCAHCRRLVDDWKYLMTCKRIWMSCGWGAMQASTVLTFSMTHACHVTFIIIIPLRVHHPVL